MVEELVGRVAEEEFHRAVAWMTDDVNLGIAYHVEYLFRDSKLHVCYHRLTGTGWFSVMKVNKKGYPFSHEKE